jgi:hypothetical protein
LKTKSNTGEYAAKNRSKQSSWDEGPWMMKLKSHVTFLPFEVRADIRTNSIINGHGSIKEVMDFALYVWHFMFLLDTMCYVNRRKILKIDSNMKMEEVIYFSEHMAS